MAVTNQREGAPAFIRTPDMYTVHLLYVTRKIKVDVEFEHGIKQRHCF